jgi:hypothetical protein
MSEDSSSSSRTSCPWEESEANGEQVAMAIDAPGGRWTECGSVKAFPTYDCSKEHHSGIVFTA